MSEALRMSKASRWAVVVSVTVTAGLALVLTFLLAIASNHRDLYERHYNWLLWVNIGVASLLALVLMGAGVRLFQRVRKGKFGSLLLARMAIAMTLVGLVPGLLIYTISYQFVSRSIESWFEPEVANALDAGINLGRTTLDTLAAQLADKTRQAAEQIGETPGEGGQTLILERTRSQLDAEDASLITASGRVIANANISRDPLQPLPPQGLVRLAKHPGANWVIEGLDDERTPARIRAVAPIPGAGLGLGTGFSSEERFLVVTAPLPARLAANALAVQAAKQAYEQRGAGRGGLKTMYLATLTLALILAVFAAILIAVINGNQMARPLLLLAEGMREVAGGDLSPKAILTQRDELGGLTRSFSEMTQQLADARTLAQRSLADLAGATTKLQAILDTLTTGVIVFDTQHRIDLLNPGARQILRLEGTVIPQSPVLADLPHLSDFAVQCDRLWEENGWTDSHEVPSPWQASMEVGKPSHESAQPSQAGQTLLVRGAWLPQGARLLVFDDITEVVSAQRAKAWSEVARRVAHEIKNPLTPIQLSAERLKHKLDSKLDEPERQMLDRAVNTIVAQVDALKTLVNAFRDYARLPAVQLQPLDLNQLIQEVAALYGEQTDQGRLVLDLTEGVPRIMGDPTQLRQVIHNLVQNALDATEAQAQPLVQLRTHALRTEDGHLRGVRLRLRDNGPGFSESVLSRPFEPYVTTKAKGTGLGLAVVKKICDEHHANIRLSNWTEAAPSPDGIDLVEALGEPRVQGAQVSLSFFGLAARDGQDPGP